MHWKTWGPLKSNVGSKSRLSYHRSSSVSSLLTLNTVWDFCFFSPCEQPGKHLLHTPDEDTAEPRARWAWRTLWQNKGAEAIPRKTRMIPARPPHFETAPCVFQVQVSSSTDSSASGEGPHKHHLVRTTCTSAPFTPCCSVFPQKAEVSFHRTILFGRDPLDQQVQPLTQLWH